MGAIAFHSNTFIPVYFERLFFHFIPTRLELTLLSQAFLFPLFLCLNSNIKINSCVLHSPIADLEACDTFYAVQIINAKSNALPA